MTLPDFPVAQAENATLRNRGRAAGTVCGYG